jgi:hypothetical protein
MQNQSPYWLLLLLGTHSISWFTVPFESACTTIPPFSLLFLTVSRLRCFQTEACKKCIQICCCYAYVHVVCFGAALQLQDEDAWWQAGWGTERSEWLPVGCLALCALSCHTAARQCLVRMGSFSRSSVLTLATDMAVAGLPFHSSYTMLLAIDYYFFEPGSNRNSVHPSVR